MVDGMTSGPTSFPLFSCFRAQTISALDGGRMLKFSRGLFMLLIFGITGEGEL